MPDQTPNLTLPWLMPAQAQKHVTVNEALGRLDALVQLSVESRTQTAQPGGPSEGQAYLLPASATGADWGAHAEHTLVYFQDGAWHGVTPWAGLCAYIRDEGALAVFDGAGWADLGALITALGNLAELGVGTSPDANNPFAAKVNAALWTALTVGEEGTGDLRFTINKEAAGNTASFLFQTGWSGRAEFGLTGNDDFAVKLSSDGSSFSQVLTVTAAGRLGLNTHTPGCALDVDADRIRLRQSSTPASASAAGQAGEMCWDSDYLYVCVAANSWKRAALSTW
jgi:hypothetical protein